MKKYPLFKFDDEQIGDAARRSLWIAFSLVSALVVAIYVFGLFTKNAFFTGMAFVLGLFIFAVFLLVYIKIMLTERNTSIKNIDMAVEQYKADLVDTYTGYDIDYTRDMIIRGADDYRKQLEEENASFVDLNRDSIKNIMIAMIHDHKQEKELKKNKRKNRR